MGYTENVQNHTQVENDAYSKTTSYLHEKVPAHVAVSEKKSISGYCSTVVRRLSDDKSSHFVETLRDAIDVDEPGDVLVVAEMSEERELAQGAFRERRLCKYARNHLDRDRLARDLVCS
jgi:regulator of RNase E activity RraA